MKLSTDEFARIAVNYAMGRLSLKEFQQAAEAYHGQTPDWDQRSGPSNTLPQTPSPWPFRRKDVA